MALAELSGPDVHVLLLNTGCHTMYLISLVCFGWKKYLEQSIFTGGKWYFIIINLRWLRLCHIVIALSVELWYFISLPIVRFVIIIGSMFYALVGYTAASSPVKSRANRSPHAINTRVRCHAAVDCLAESFLPVEAEPPKAAVCNNDQLIHYSQLLEMN